MSSGFNTDIKIGEHVFHVQTEDRGPTHPAIDTLVYQSGRILHRKSSNYDEFAASASFTPESLRQRVEDQHRSVIEALRSGALGDLGAEIAAADLANQAVRPPGIQIQLLNPSSWLSAGKVSLQLEISRRADRQPQAGAQVDAIIEGALRDGTHSAQSDAEGRAHIQFALPPLGKGDLALIIQAQSDAAKDEIRFSMRTRAKTAQVSEPQ